MLSWPDVAAAWNGFFHTPESPVSLALFRIAFGVLLVINAGLLRKDVPRYYGPLGLVSTERIAWAYGKTRLTLFNLLPNTLASAYLVLALHAVAAACLAVGLGTRVSAGVAFVTLVSLHHRNPCVLHSGDSLHRLLLFLLMFSHAGDVLSVDAWLTRGLAADALAGSPVDPWCQRLMQIQVSIVYLRTIWWKLQGRTWLDGTAAYYPTQLDVFRRFPVPPIVLSRFFTALVTWSTLLIETALGTLVWFREGRYPVLLTGCVLHLLLEYSLNLQLFGWTMLATYLLFIDPQDAVAWLREFAGP
jgi:hypothetical protein